MVTPPSSLPPPPPLLPSRHFCQTGELEEGESYHPDIHNMGSTPRERCSQFYQEYAGGRKRKRTRRVRKNKKSRKNRKKTYRR